MYARCNFSYGTGRTKVSIPWTESKQMLSHLYLMTNKGLVAIPEKYEKLIISLRTAQANEYSLDKDQISYDDLSDALRLSLKGFMLK